MSDVTMLSRSLAGGKRTAKVEGRVLVSLHGLEHVASLEQERLRRVCGLSAIPGDGQ